MAADTLGIPYQSCLVVEDAVSGVQAALTLGCYTAGIGNGGTVPEVHYRINTMGELSDILIEEMLVPHLTIFLGVTAVSENAITKGIFRVVSTGY